MLALAVVPGSSAPIYQQIVDQVCAAVAGGQAATGDALPSVRALAEQLVVNPNTIAKAYAQLVDAGVVEARPGKGVFIAKRRQVFSAKERGRRLEAAAERLASEAHLLGASADEAAEAVRRAISRTAAPSNRGGTDA
jgi:GntR family transcriptional regulator